jgi:hypothetical protein
MIWRLLHFYDIYTRLWVHSEANGVCGTYQTLGMEMLLQLRIFGIYQRCCDFKYLRYSKRSRA